MGADYGLWSLVVVNTLLVLFFAISFYRPGNNRRDWTVMGGFGAFTVALFAEMYGAPLTIYLLSGWLGSRFPLLRPDHAGGHLWNDLIGWQGDPHTSPFHMLSYVFILAGFWLIAIAWRILHRAAGERRLAVEGPYAWLRHPQYLGFLLVMTGFLLQWPTIPTLVMFPVLAWVYSRLARREEREVAEAFGPAWDAYAAHVRAFLPHRLSRPTATGSLLPPNGGHRVSPSDPQHGRRDRQCPPLRPALDKGDSSNGFPFRESDRVSLVSASQIPRSSSSTRSSHH